MESGIDTATQPGAHETQELLAHFIRTEGPLTPQANQLQQHLVHALHDDRDVTDWHIAALGIVLDVAPEVQEAVVDSAVCIHTPASLTHV